MANLESGAPGWKDIPGPVLVLGAGGSARAVVYGFLEAGKSDIRVCNRSVERAQALAQHFGRGVTASSWEERLLLATTAAVTVNTTTLGMNGVSDPGIDFSGARRGAVAVDLVYVPLETQFLEKARARGLIAVGGLGMLLYQAVPGFEKWFGVRPEVTPELYDTVQRDLTGV
jgi:shikimate dehydrogenase